ncbi:tetratricopeptide repeat protein [Luteimonas sp. e5]
MNFAPRILVSAIALTLAGLIAAPDASAQLAGKRERRSSSAKAQANKPAPEFPNATREEPKAQTTEKGAKQLQALGKLYDEDKFAELLEKAEAFSGNAGNAYEKAFALQLAAVAATELEQGEKAIALYQAALDADGLDNNSHYRMMSNLAVLQSQQEQWDAAIATIDRFLSETRSEDPKYLTMKGSLLAAANRHAEAAALFQQLLAKSPDDKKLLMNAVATLQQADKFSEANALLMDAHKRGLLDEEREYRALYSGLLNDEKWREAAQVIEDGVAKGVLPKNEDLGKAWSVTANRAYFDEDMEAAARYYAEAAPLLSDGEGWLNLAKIYSQQQDKAKAREAAKQALAKGVKNRAEAERLSNLK